MTRGKLLDNDTAFHFYFYSNNDATSPKGPRKQTTEPILGTALLEKKKKNQLQPVEWESVAWLSSVMTYWEIMPSSCPLTL